MDGDVGVTNEKLNPMTDSRVFDDFDDVLEHAAVGVYAKLGSAFE